MHPKIGLQRDSISGIGNNLFGFVLGSAAAIIGVLAYGGGIASEIGNGGTMQTVARILPLLGIIVLILYYLIDWYDLNLAVYIDEFVGRKQVCLYVISALVVGALPPLAVAGKIDIAGLLAALYFPLADRKRDDLLHEKPREVTNPMDLVSFGENKRTVEVLRILLWVVSVITLGMAVWSLTVKITDAKFAVALGACLVLLWLVACILKMLRSVCFLQPVYERRLAELGLLVKPDDPPNSVGGAMEDEDED